MNLTSSMGRIAITILSVFVSGCTESGRQPLAGGSTDDSTTVILDGYAGRVDTLSSELFSREAIFSNLVDLAVWDTVVVATERNGDPFVHLISGRSGKVIRSFGRLGDGPGEFKGALMPIVIGAHEKSLWLVDINGQRLVRPNAWNPERAHLPGPTVAVFKPRGIAPIAGLTTSFFTMRRDKAGNVLQFFDTLGIGGKSKSAPQVGDPRLSGEQLANAYSVQVCASPKANKAAVDYISASRVDIVDLDDLTTTAAGVPFHFLPKVVENPTTHRTLWMGGGRLGYGKCVADSTHVYSLFRGVLRSAFDIAAPDPRLVSFVHVFDWNGVLVRVIRLDHWAASIALDSETGTLYTVAFDRDGWVAIRKTFLDGRASP